jgi:hypothetical protein
MIILLIIIVVVVVMAFLSRRTLEKSGFFSVICLNKLAIRMWSLLLFFIKKFILIEITHILKT